MEPPVKKACKEFVCAVCQKIYRTKKYFTKHVQSHQPAPASSDTTHSVLPDNVSTCRQSALPQDAEVSNLLPEGYDWGAWSDDDDDGATPVLTYFEMEDEEEEERREGAVEKAKSGSNKKKKEAALVKCQDCSSSFTTIDGYLKHRVGHGMKAAYLKRPTLEVTLGATPQLAKTVLENMSSTRLTQGLAPKVAEVAKQLLSAMDDIQVKRFIEVAATSITSCLEKDKEEFLFPSSLAVSFFKKVSVLMVNKNQVNILLEIVEKVVLSEVQVLQVFVPAFIMKFGDKVLARTFHVMTFGDSSDSATSLSERYAVTKQSTESLDFQQTIHYIGGSNVKSVLRTAFRNRSPNSEWRRVVDTIKKNFVVNSLAEAPRQELMAWTLTQDRGKLQKISDKALSFFLQLAREVKPLERLDGSLLNSEVFDTVGKSTSLLSLWDSLRGSLDESESFKLLQAIVGHFCVTWRNGILSRRQDEMALAKRGVQKFGTDGIAFRAKLGGH